jgi:putative hydrolase of the HAD superfamily
VARSGLLVDYGGVLTSDLFESFADFCTAEGLDPQVVRHTFSGDREAAKLLVKFECGAIPESEFEPALAAKLGVQRAEGMIDRLFAGMRPEPAMVEAVALARRSGVRTGLLSNSWGRRYDRSRWDELFDEIVISGDVGMRKPDPRIYALAAEKLGLPPEEIVFVDDLEQNLAPARAAGMGAVHHHASRVERTIAELERELGVTLTAPPG